MNYEEIKYLVIDVESVPDSRLIKSVKFPGDDIDENTAVLKFQEEILESTNGKSTFIPVTFQYPVSVCIAKILEDFTIQEIVSLDEPLFRASEMTRLFWHGIENLYKNSVIVTFNGRGFDIPLMELMAYRYGQKAKRHFKDKYAGRNRFSDKHIDLQDWLSNYGSIKMNGGLNLLAKIIGKPGKGTTKGEDVYEMNLKGMNKEINEYCIQDVLDTYFVFLRTRVMTGDISVAREHDIVEAAKKMIESRQEEVPAFREYYRNWGDWKPWP